MTNIKSPSSIYIDGVLFDIDLYWWKGWTQLDAEMMELEEQEIPDIVQLGRIRLLKHDAFKDFQLIEGRCRALVQKYSYPFMISTVRFVPYSVLADLLSDLEDYKKLFNNFVELFVFYYEQNRMSFINEYPAYREKLAGKYPVAKDIKYKFNFSWSIFEMKMPDNIKAEIIGESEALNLQKIYEKSKGELQVKLNSWIDSVGISMRKEISAVCKNMSDSLDAGKIIRTSTLERTRETIKRLRSMNFIGDEGISVLLDDLEFKVPSNFDREVPAIMNAFNGTLKAIINEAGDLSDINEYTGDYKRSLIL
jgi:hypothetical protein